MKKILTGVLILTVCLFSYVFVAQALTNTWPDNDARVDGSSDTLDELDTFINTLSQDIHERVLSSDGETVQIQTNWTATGKTCADLGTVTTADINAGTIDNITAITTSGNVGIGSTAATTARLTVTGGNVGIGTTAPATALQVVGTATIATADINAGTVDAITSLTVANAVDIGSYGLTALTFTSDQATGTAPLTVASTTKVTNLNADTLDGYNTGTSAAASTIYVSDGSNYLPDDTVDTTALKTAMSAVSSASLGNQTLPGGEYGFYPQIKVSAGSSLFGVGGLVNNFSYAGTSYTTNVALGPSGGTAYAQQRYVTASGIDQWIFVMIDKITKDIISVWQAPDHPSYGNGGDTEIVPHPFLSYDNSKHLIVLLNKETCNKLEDKATKIKDIVTLINEDYRVDMSEEFPYVPLHSGKFIDQAPVMIETIPDYITVRRLVKLTPAEKAQKEAKQQQKQQELEAKKALKEQNKTKAKQKLKSLGLKDDEIETLFGE